VTAPRDTIIGPRLEASATAVSASVTQASQMYTLGPAISFATSLGGRSQKVHTASRAATRVRHTRCHQLPPAALTICWTR
jgi:hypothetical protein